MCTENLEQKKPTIKGFFKTIKNERDLELLKRRLAGEKLEQIGNEYNLTKERVRQIINMILKQKPILQEDSYRPIFQKYDIGKFEFITIFDVSEVTYNYLNYIYKKGKRNMIEILDTNECSGDIQKKIERIVCSDYINVGNERIHITVKEIVGYLIKTYGQEAKTTNELFHQYMEFLKRHDLQKNQTLIISQRSLESIICEQKNIMLGRNKQVRFYDKEEYDVSRFLLLLNLEVHHNVLVSTLKIFRENKDIMDEYNILDEYELHSFLKRILKNEKKDRVQFRRMPMIEFGTADLKKQVLELIVEMAPVSSNDLAQRYEMKYGVKSATVKANMLKKFSEYYHNGLYNIDLISLEEEKLEKLRSSLKRDFYFLDEVEEIFNQVVGGSDSNLLHNSNLKRLGYKSNSNCIYSDRFHSAEQYFSEVVLSKEMVDFDEIEERILKLQPFQRALKNLRKTYELMEFSYGQYISFRRLKKMGITKESLKSYCNCVSEFLKDREYFTIQSLLKNGFVDPLNELEFEEVFYCSVLRADNRFAFRRLGTTFLFQKSQNQLSLKEFTVNLVSELGRIEMNDLLRYMEEYYGIGISSGKIRELIGETKTGIAN